MYNIIKYFQNKKFTDNPSEHILRFRKVVGEKVYL